MFLDYNNRELEIGDRVWYRDFNTQQIIYSKITLFNDKIRCVILENGMIAKDYNLHLTNLEGNTEEINKSKNKIKLHIDNISDYTTKLVVEDSYEKRTQLWWDYYFLGMAEYVSLASKDPSTQCGCVIVKDKHVLSTGYNGFAKGVKDTKERYEDRDTKISLILHAEKNAIATAESSVKGSTVYNTPFMPCSQCAAYLIQYGVIRVVSKQVSDDLKQRWGESIELSTQQFKEAGVELILL